VIVSSAKRYKTPYFPGINNTGITQYLLINATIYTMRIPTVPPDQLTPEQKPLYDALYDSIEKYLFDFTTHTEDGTLIGPFNAMLRFPDLGTAAWTVFLALTQNPVLPPLAREVVILYTGAATGSLYEIYSHEAVAKRKGLSDSKIRTISAGQRPPDLSLEEALAFDCVSMLARGKQIHETLYKAIVEQFGERGAAEIAYLHGCYTLIASLLNVFDVDIPRTEGFP